MKFKFYNDTGRVVSIHPATFMHGCAGSRGQIQPLEERTFTLPEGTYPWVKMWDYKDNGLSLLISPIVDEEVVSKRRGETLCTHGYSWDDCPDCRH